MHRLSGRPLDQIVDHRHHDQRIAAIGAVHSDTAGIGSAHRTCVGLTARGQHIDETLAGITLFKQSLKISLLGNARIQGCQNAADHRRQVRDKGEPDRATGSLGKAFFYFRHMAVAGDGVSGEIIRSLGKINVQLGFAPRPGHTRLGVGHNVTGVYEPGLQQRQQAQLHGGRITPGVADHARLLDRGAVDFGQPVDRLLHQIGRAVLELVPLLPFHQILQPEISSKVDDAYACGDKAVRIAHRHPMGRGEKNHIALFKTGAGRLAKRQIDVTAQ